ncbi:NADH-quinone oxidoreductase subunit A [Gammaproteobacteria bacterium]|nr:NADH-quinone oxidoreductase subunit A [Gammaproteobacteria bacterium]
MIMTEYAPILVFLVLAIGLAIAPLMLSYLLRPNRPDSEKNSAYECGFESFGDARVPFDVRFYLVAILFIVFDLETAFLFPWAVVFKQDRWPAFWGMLVFLGILLIGFVYEWQKGAIEWE